MPTTICPQCGRPGSRQAFPTTTTYVTCSLGHVFPTTKEED